MIAVVAVLVGARPTTVPSTRSGRDHQAAFLRNAGRDIAQGYLFGRPMPPRALLEAWT